MQNKSLLASVPMPLFPCFVPMALWLRRGIDELFFSFHMACFLERAAYVCHVEESYIRPPFDLRFVFLWLIMDKTRKTQKISVLILKG